MSELFEEPPFNLVIEEQDDPERIAREAQDRLEAARMALERQMQIF